MTAVNVGVRKNRVTAMHHATEYGIWGALYEMGQATNSGSRVEKERSVMDNRMSEICLIGVLSLIVGYPFFSIH